MIIIYLSIVSIYSLYKYMYHYICSHANDIYLHTIYQSKTICALYLPLTSHKISPNIFTILIIWNLVLIFLRKCDRSWEEFIVVRKEEYNLHSLHDIEYIQDAHTFEWEKINLNGGWYMS